MAMLVGDDESGWYYYSKDGTEEGALPFYGPTSAGIEQFSNLEEFVNWNTSYDFGYRIETDAYQDYLAGQEAFNNLNENYNLFTNNCADMVQEALDAAGLNSDSDNSYPNNIMDDLMDSNEGEYNEL